MVDKKKKNKEWKHTITCRKCGKTKATRYKDVCQACYMKYRRHHVWHQNKPRPKSLIQRMFGR